MQVLSPGEEPAKVQREEVKRGRIFLPRVTSCPGTSKRPKLSVDRACPPYQLLSSELAVASARLKAIRVPSGFGWKPVGRSLFKSTAGMKSHDFKQVATHGILKFCLRGHLEDEQRRALFAFLDALSAVFRESISQQQIQVEYALD